MRRTLAVNNSLFCLQRLPTDELNNIETTVTPFPLKMVALEAAETYRVSKNMYFEPQINIKVKIL